MTREEVTMTKLEFVQVCGDAAQADLMRQLTEQFGNKVPSIALAKELQSIFKRFGDHQSKEVNSTGVEHIPGEGADLLGIEITDMADYQDSDSDTEKNDTDDSAFGELDSDISDEKSKGAKLGMLAGMESILELVENGKLKSLEQLSAVLKNSIKDIDSTLDLPSYEERKKGYKELAEADEKEIKEISAMIKNGDTRDAAERTLEYISRNSKK